MKKRIPYKTTNISILPECWVLEESEEYSHVKKSSRHKKLPRIRRQYEDILKEKGIPYHIVYTDEGEMCEYWNSECVEETELTLPLYINIQGTYMYTEKLHTDKVCSSNMINRALEMEYKIKRIIEEEERKVRKEHLYHNLKLIIGDKTVVVFCSYILKSQKEEDFMFGTDHFKMLPVQIIGSCGIYNTEWYVVFNVNKIELDSVLDLEVPKGKEGIFIGKDAWQLREWCEKLGLSKINVVGV